MAGKLTLGRTRIGDLLLENKITETSIGDVLDNVKLTIPPYQRPYKWTAKNAIRLLDDIEQAMHEKKEVYRVGTLILHHNEDNYDIVDGQQRVITFSLLLSCICSKREVPLLNQGLSNNQYNLRNVLNNHSALDRRIKNLGANKKEELSDYVRNHCELIVVITDDLSEAFQFFDSQNARGKALYPHDLLKAYHLREMSGVDANETEEIVKTWENLDQKKLSELFNEYLYRLKEWVNGNRAYELNKDNIDIFKGVTSRDNYPYAQFYKGAFTYAKDFNKSGLPYATGLQLLRPFQINAPIIAGKAFFEYAKHYSDCLADIQNNDKYEGYLINVTEIVRTLKLRKYKNGVGNRITRLMFDTAILLYVDKFCSIRPTRIDTELLDRFVVFAFVWAYSMRAQYSSVGWQVAQNYVMGNKAKVNSFNIYKEIAGSDSPSVLLSRMADRIESLQRKNITKKSESNWNSEDIKEWVNKEKTKASEDNREDNEDGYYMDIFKKHQFWRENNEEKE